MPYRLCLNKAVGVVGLFLLASVVYVWGLSPTISWRDTSEFVTVAHTLGIGHPAGSPTYSLLAKLSTFLPIGNIALRVNAFSALAGVLTVVVLFMLLYDLLAEAAPWGRWVAALSAALFLLVSESLWRLSEVAEVYSLQNCFLVVLLYLLHKTRTCAQPISMRCCWLFAFLYGLSAGVHATMAFFVPAFFAFIWCVEPRVLRGKGLAFLAFFFLLGFAVYLYLPIRSLAEPAFDWGDPQTLRQFLIHITDRKDSDVHLVFMWAQLPHQIGVYLANLSNEFSTFGIALGILGCGYITYKDRPLSLALSLIFLGNVGFFISWTAAFGFIPSFVIFSLWIGFGVHACLMLLITLYQRYYLRIPHYAVYAGLLGGIAVTLSVTFARHLPVVKQAQNYSAVLYGQQLIEQLPPDAILFCDYAWFPLLYLQQIERQRPDLTFILRGEVFHPTFYSFISQERYPNVRVVTSDQPVKMSTLEYFWRFSKLNAQDHPLFWDPNPQADTTFSEHLTPKGLLSAFNPYGKVEVTPEVLRTHWKTLSRSTNHVLQGQGALDHEASDFLAYKLNIIAVHFRKTGFTADAAKTYEAAISIQPSDRHTRNNYGALLLSQEQLPEALEQLNIAYSLDPVHPMYNKNLGKLMLLAGDFARAVYFFERALASGALEVDVYAQLGEAYAKSGRPQAARDALQSALTLLTNPDAPHLPDDGLQEKLAWIQKMLRLLEAEAETGPEDQEVGLASPVSLDRSAQYE